MVYGEARLAPANVRRGSLNASGAALVRPS